MEEGGKGWCKWEGRGGREEGETGGREREEVVEQMGKQMVVEGGKKENG